jgi:uncharacterized protein YgbK (DUF1537 family)
MLFKQASRGNDGLFVSFPVVSLSDAVIIVGSVAPMAKRQVKSELETARNVVEAPQDMPASAYWHLEESRQSC